MLRGGAASRTLLNGTGDVGEYRIRVRPNQADGSDYDNQNGSDHDCVFSDVLAFFFEPKCVEECAHKFPPAGAFRGCIVARLSRIVTWNFARMYYRDLPGKRPPWQPQRVNRYTRISSGRMDADLQRGASARARMMRGGGGRVRCAHFPSRYPRRFASRPFSRCLQRLEVARTEVVGRRAFWLGLLFSEHALL